MFDHLAENFSCEKGKHESKKERAEKGCLGQNNLTYGEIMYESIAQCLHYIRNKYGAFSKPGGTFVDLGHGTGKGVLTAALMHRFDKCMGIELLDNLYEQSLLLKDEYDSYVKDNQDESQQKNAAESGIPSFEVHHGDMLKDLDWSGADLVLANSTCFDQSLLNEIAKKCSELKKGTWMLTLTKRLPSAEVNDEETETPMPLEWECVLSIKREMSWGQATIHI